MFLIEPGRVPRRGPARSRSCSPEPLKRCSRAAVDSSHAPTLENHRFDVHLAGDRGRVQRLPFRLEPIAAVDVDVLPAGRQDLLERLDRDRMSLSL